MYLPPKEVTNKYAHYTNGQLNKEVQRQEKLENKKEASKIRDYLTWRTNSHYYINL